MSEGTRQDDRGESPTDLRAALRRARLSEAEHSDVIVDLRAAEATRLELLAEELQPVIDQLPPGTDLIDCQIVPGHRPRLWIDMLAYVQMGRDKRGYELVTETRAGSQVLFRSDDVHAVTGKVTDYIAHRLVERERLVARAREPRLIGDGTARSQVSPVSTTPGATGNAPFWQIAFGFTLGIVAGIVAMLVLGLVITG